MEPSQLGYLKGVNRDKGHREFILVQPLAVEVKTYSSLGLYCLGFDHQGANTLDLVLDLLFLALSRRGVIPLYTQVDARRLTESRPAHTHVSSSVTIYACLTIQVIHTWWFIHLGRKSPLGLGPSTGSYSPPSSVVSRQWYNPAPPGQFIPSSYIPNRSCPSHHSLMM